MTMSQSEGATKRASYTCFYTVRSTCLTATLFSFSPRYFYEWSRAYSFAHLNLHADVYVRSTTLHTAKLKRESIGRSSPQGSRNTEGGLKDFKPGAFKLAIEMKVPIVPIGAFHFNQVSCCNIRSVALTVLAALGNNVNVDTGGEI